MELKDYAARRIEKTSSTVIKKDWKYLILDWLIHNGDRVLDIGCASGKFASVWLHKNIDYTGVDYNQAFIDHCIAQWLSVKQYDASKDILPFPDHSFDFIYCAHVVEHLLTNEQIAFFQEISRVLAPGGRLFLAAPTPYHWYFWDDETHQRPCTHGQLGFLARNAWLQVIQARYSLVRYFSDSLQRFLRLPPLRWFLWEVYLIAQKDN